MGHAALFSDGEKIRRQMSSAGQKARLGALCFDTLSSSHFCISGVSQLMTLERKLDTFKSMGLDFAYVCDFSQIRDMSPTEFIEEILIKKCNCIGVVCGFNFRFGKNAAGNADFLVSYFNKISSFKNSCSIVPPVSINGTVVSSSHIRDLLSRGDIEGANDMLGRNYSITHPVVHGKNLGSRLGFPTINHIFSDAEVIPSLGIYATRTTINHCSFISVTNVGTRPTVSSSGTVTCETHLIGVDSRENFYGEIAEVFFYKKIRDEKRFSSQAELSNAIAADIETTKNILIYLNT